MAKIFINTFGCTLNQSDSEVMAGLLEKHGFEIVNNLKDSDLVVINTCTVKNSAEAKAFAAIRDAEKNNKKIIVAGCVAQAQKDYLETKLKNYSVVGVEQLNNIAEVVEQTLQGNVVHLLAEQKSKRLNLPKIRRDSIIEIVPICAGCLGYCTYCKAKQARGELYSYDEKEIVKQVCDAVKEGVKEVWLTAQDTGTYGKDIGTTLPELLRKILEIEGDFRVRLGMCNPNFALEYLDELIEIFKHEKMFKFFHIPVQSGDNEILKLMNRKYSIDDYKKIIQKIRKEIPNITVSTDIIVAFPGETEEQFRHSLKLVEETKPNVLNISRYWARPGTIASRLKPAIDPKESKQRSKKLKEVFDKNALEENKHWIGWQGKIIIDEKGKHNTFIGRNDCYKQVIVKGKHSIGDIVKVKIKRVMPHDLRAF